MADHCGHCRGTDVVYAFNTFQCMNCGGHSHMDGTPTVPTSALEIGATFEGPGAELVADKKNPPFKAIDKVVR